MREPQEEREGGRGGLEGCLSLSLSLSHSLTHSLSLWLPLALARARALSLSTREGNEEFAVGLQIKAGGYEIDAEGKGLAEILKTSAAKHIDYIIYKGTIQSHFLRNLYLYPLVGHF